MALPMERAVLRSARQPRPRLCRSVALCGLLLVGLLCPTAGVCVGPGIRFNEFSLEQGLSQTSVYAIHQDNLGFLWFGTEDGLNRFDGYEFEVFKHDPEDPHSLGNSWVWDIHQDTAGRLWIATNGGGLSLFDPVHRSFTNYGQDAADPESLSHPRVRFVFEDSSQRLWVGTDGGGLNRFDPERHVFEHFRAQPGGLADDRVLCMAEDAVGSLWVGTWSGGLQRLDPEKGSFATFAHDPQDPQSLSHNHVNSLLVDREGMLWVGTMGGGLNRLDRGPGTFTHFRHDPEDASSLPDDSVRALLEDPAGALWVATDAGLSVSQSPGTFRNYHHDPSYPHGLSDDRVRSLLQDKGGVLWIGTQQAGLNSFNPVAGYFPHYRRGLDGSGLSSNSTTSFATDSVGNLWVGTLGGGLNRLDRKTGRYAHYRADGEPSSLGDDRVMSLVMTGDEELWVGTYGGGLSRYDRAADRFISYRHDAADPESLSSDAIAALLENRDGSLWVGTFGGGLNRLDRSSGKVVEHYEQDVVEPRSLASDRVLALYEDRDGSLWVGTDGGGLSRKIVGSADFSNYLSDDGDGSAATVMTVHEDAEGVLWVGTRGRGLGRLLPTERAREDPHFEWLTEREGLPSNTVYGIVADDHGDLWLSTNQGVARLDRKTLAFKAYTTVNGLQSNEFNFGAYHRSDDGEIFFGGINGFNAFFPDQIRGNQHLPPVQVTAVFKANRALDLGETLANGSEIRIGHRDYVVSFEFAALDFTAPSQNEYSYRLIGFDEEWNHLGTSRRATYTNLDPGRYTLRVRGSNNEGLWNEDGLSLSIRVLPPPWQTWWAYSLFGVAIAILLYSFVRVQSRKLAREAEYSRKLEEEVRERTRELEEASLTDALTGLRNRRYLMTHIQEDLALVDRYYESRPEGEVDDGKHALFFLMIDLDGLKKVNDLFGHAAGDRVILQMRDLLRDACRGSDSLIRLGGDEFLIAGRGVTWAAAASIAERIRAAVADHVFALGSGNSMRLSCSLGYAFYPFLHHDPTRISGDQVITIADRALYLAKSSGRNAWVGIHSTGRTAADDLLEMIHYRLEPLVKSGSIELESSLPHDSLVWNRQEKAVLDADNLAVAPRKPRAVAGCSS